MNADPNPSNNHKVSLSLPPLSSLTWIQGSPATDLTRDLKLCLLIQPNCPGCHQHALPVLSQIFQEQQQQGSPTFDCYVISTAFEDFEFNTIESARKLVEHQELIGVARTSLGSASSALYYDKLAMPVAHDVVVVPTADQADGSPLKQLALDATRAQLKQELISRHGVLPPAQLNMLLSQVNESMLPPKIAHVFYSVRAGGTPTWILHNKDGLLLDQLLGAVSKEKIMLWIDTVRKQNKI